MARFYPKRQPDAVPALDPRRGARSQAPSRSGRAVVPAVPVDDADASVIEAHALAREGPHCVSLIPSRRGGYRYALFYFQPVGGQWVRRAAGPLRDPVLASLWWHECRHAESLGWPDDPRFGLHLHALLCGSAYPLDVSALTAARAAAIPHGLEWC